MVHAAHPVEPGPWAAGLDWACLVLANVGRVLVSTALGLALMSAGPVALGWEPTTVTTGSMEPQIRVGDVVVTRAVTPSEVRPGHVLLVEDPDFPGRLRLHRMVDRDAQGRFILKGDANARADSTPVLSEGLKGVGVLRVPWAGVPVVWARSGQWVRLAVLAVALGLALAACSLDRHLRDGTEDAVDPPGGGKSHDAGGSGDGADDAVADGVPPIPQPQDGPPSVLVPVGRWAMRVGVPLALATALGLTSASGAVLSGQTSSAASFDAAYLTCANAVLASGPSVYYKFDSGSTNNNAQVTDSSGFARHGSYGAGNAADTAFPCASDAGRSIRLNGTSGAIYGPTTAVTPPTTFTIAVWFRTSVAQGKLLGWGSSRTGSSASADRHLYIDSTGRLVFGVNPGTMRTVRSTAAVTDGAWHHAAATLSAAGMRLYLDGQLVASDAATTTAQTYSGAYLRIGYDNLASWPNAPTSPYFSGSLDDATFWDTTALSAQQVRSIWTARS